MLYIKGKKQGIETHKTIRSEHFHERSGTGEVPRSTWFHIKLLSALLVISKGRSLDFSRRFTKTKGFVSTLKATFISLILKEYKVEYPKNFRPITLCNVIYKVITKLIALRLKPLLPHLFSRVKTLYVEGRKIMNNAILTHKVIH